MIALFSTRLRTRPLPTQCGCDTLGPARTLSRDRVGVPTFRHVWPLCLSVSTLVTMDNHRQQPINSRSAILTTNRKDVGLYCLLEPILDCAAALITSKYSLLWSPLWTIDDERRRELQVSFQRNDTDTTNNNQTVWKESIANRFESKRWHLGDSNYKQGNITVMRLWVTAAATATRRWYPKCLCFRVSKDGLAM